MYSKQFKGMVEDMAKRGATGTQVGAPKSVSDIYNENFTKRFTNLKSFKKSLTSKHLSRVL
jgi:hypothetical protein